MSGFEKSKEITRNTNRLGLVDANQVYDLIKETIDEFGRYNQTEPAIVDYVYMKANDLPKRKLANYDVPDWSVYGTIAATFINSNEALPKFIKPLNNNIVHFPVKGELVNITKFAGEWYYSSPLNIKNKVNMNRTPGQRGDGTVTPQDTKFNRKVWSGIGSTIVQGRFGNSIKLGSDSLYQTPTIKIVNGQNQKIDTLQYKNLSANYPHIEDINSDGSSIYMTAGTDEIALIPATDTPNLPKSLYGNQVIINSDRLIFNAKGEVKRDGVNLTGAIHMLAADDIVITAADKIILESTEVCLGPDSEIAKNPLVKYEELKGMLINITTVLKALCDNVEVASIVVDKDGKTSKTVNTTTHKKVVESIRKSIGDIATKNVFTTFE
tara:strand:+ start:489 stop:1631 length:1143 start_codon:yes stop_codon:yes gene_type:complete